jgi:dTDP-4-dehydrorhamnose reductase
MSDMTIGGPVPGQAAVTVAVCGAGGQTGFEVQRAAWPPGWRLAALDRSALDITRGDMVMATLADLQPQLVINLAAYTAVDRAESETERAWAANCAGPGHLADSCARLGIPLIHLSTDYVFDGNKPEPYREDDPVNPLGVYGASKEAGERQVRERLPRHLILRTSWVYGVHGGNFVKTMLRLGGERDELRVVADQRGCPTAAAEIAAMLVGLSQRAVAGDADWGTYHFAGSGTVSWHGFAEAIFDLAAPRTGRRPRVAAIRTDEYPTAAKRPLNSVLDCSRIEARFGIVRKPWREALAPVVAEWLDLAALAESHA